MAEDSDKCAGLRISKASAERCVTHSYACDCREYRYERMREALIRIMVLADADVVSGDIGHWQMADIAKACRDGLHE